MRKQLESGLTHVGTLTRIVNCAVYGGLAALTLIATSGSAQASINLVTNGGFEQTLIPGSAEFGARYPAQQVLGWTTDSYSFVFAPGTADTTGAPDEYFLNDDPATGTQEILTLWGPNNGSPNGLPPISPAGGNYIGADGAYFPGPISQQINGLNPGHVATVSFYWAAAQQYGYDGETTQGWVVSLGNQTQSTPLITLPNHGFSGWMHQTFAFTPGNSSETLSFLAVGAPDFTFPPFSLLDGVEVTTPEPGVWGMGVALFAALGICTRLRRKSASSAV